MVCLEAYARPVCFDPYLESSTESVSIRSEVKRTVVTHRGKVNVIVLNDNILFLYQGLSTPSVVVLSPPQIPLYPVSGSVCANLTLNSLAYFPTWTGIGRVL